MSVPLPLPPGDGVGEGDGGDDGDQEQQGDQSSHGGAQGMTVTHHTRDNGFYSPLTSFMFLLPTLVPNDDGSHAFI